MKTLLMKTLLAQALSNIADAACEETPTYGLCSLISAEIDALCDGDDPDFSYTDLANFRYAWINRAFEAWDEYSGACQFPVPSLDDPGMSARDAFYLPASDVNAPFTYAPRWDTATEYGRARWRLLAFLLERISEELERDANELLNS